jgi:peptidoglycan/LPS O-acetylase OafA/YrhL
MAGWIWRDRIRLSLWGVLLFGAVWFGLRGTVFAFPALVLFLGYATAWLAYVPGGVLRHYNRLGDYSYGLYIYAFPIQGLVAWAFGSLGPGLHILLATPPVLLLSVASWHLVEDPALRLLKHPQPHRPKAA